MYTGPAAAGRQSGLGRRPGAGLGRAREMLTQGQALAEADEHAAADEAAEVVLRGKGLHEGGDDGEEAADAHSPFPAQEIRLPPPSAAARGSPLRGRTSRGRTHRGAADEEAGNNGADGVCRV